MELRITSEAASALIKVISDYMEGEDPTIEGAKDRAFDRFLAIDYMLTDILRQVGESTIPPSKYDARAREINEFYTPINYSPEASDEVE